MAAADEIEGLLAQAIDHHERHGELPSIDALAGDRPDVAAQLRVLIHRYLDLTMSLDEGLRSVASASSVTTAEALPVIEGFRTVERLGQGGMGAVYKLEDLKLKRLVAGKVIRQDGDPRIRARLADFLREAQSLALFSDRRVVQVFEFRSDANPPVIIMELVEGFELGRMGRSLEFRQRATIVREVALAIGRAHALGLQHRDLKPSNVMLDSQLNPKILDFGLSGSDPGSGHLRGTPAYIAPEQLDPSQPIDARTDIYALGVILYELITGVTPYGGRTDGAIVAAIREGQPRLPVEIDPTAPEALQAIALKAMERRPADRYPSAEDMALDLERYLDGRPVSARPSQYAATLGAKVRPHVDQIGDWLRMNLIYPHEAARLQTAYRQLEAREDEWIIASRSLSYSQIALYLGAFFLFAGSLFYFWMHRVEGAVTGVALPFFVLGVPFIGLNAAGRWLYQREHQAVAIAFYLAGVSLLPLLLLIWFHETSLWTGVDDDPTQLFGGTVSNRQLQITALVATAWSSWLALRTRTAALSIVSTILGFVLAVAVLAEFDLRRLIEAREFHRLALRLAPLAALYAVAGFALERAGRAWFARPLYVAAGIVTVIALDLVAFNGKMFQHLGVSLQRLQPAGVSSPVLIDTATALTLNGILIYLLAVLVERRGTPMMSTAAHVLFTIAPFSILEPLAYLSETAEYSPRFDWMYLVLAITIAVLSHARQRRSFYYAGLVNSGIALYLIAVRNEWFDKPAWAITIVAVGLAALAFGFWLDASRRRRT